MSALYDAQILRLAVALGNQGRLDRPATTVERRSKTCGSVVIVDLVIDSDGVIRAFGQEVRACALGQASAALLGQSIVGSRVESVLEAEQALRDFLARKRDDPGPWPGLDILERARNHPARHPSIRLPFEAAVAAIAITSP